MSFPKRLRVEGAASRTELLGSQRRGGRPGLCRGLSALLLISPVLSRIIWHLEKQERKLLKSSQGQMLSWYKTASLPCVQLSHLHLHQLRIWFLALNLA